MLLGDIQPEQDLVAVQISGLFEAVSLVERDWAALALSDARPHRADFLFSPRDIPHAYVVRSERARMLVTASPGGVEQVFVSQGVPVTGSEPPTDAVMPAMDELVRLFSGYGCEIVGPPISLADLS